MRLETEASIGRPRANGDSSESRAYYTFLKTETSIVLVIIQHGATVEFIVRLTIWSDHTQA